MKKSLGISNQIAFKKLESKLKRDEKGIDSIDTNYWLTCQTGSLTLPLQANPKEYKQRSSLQLTRANALITLPKGVSVLHFIIHVVRCSFVRKQSTIQLTLHMILKSWSIREKEKKISQFIGSVALCSFFETFRFRKTIAENVAFQTYFYCR
jgi:hypothetical protein